MEKDKVINDLLKRISDLEYEVERLNNIMNKLESFTKDELVTILCEIENKRIGYGQTEVDKIWLHNLWGIKKYIISKCDEILKGE